MSDFKYFPSEIQARLLNKRGELVNKYFPEIVAKLNAFDGKVVKVDGSFTEKAKAAGICYAYDSANLPHGCRIVLSVSTYGTGIFHKQTLSLQVSYYENIGDVAHHAPEWSYWLGELDNGRMKEIKIERVPERTDWTVEEIDALKAEYEKAKGDYEGARHNARHFIS